MSDQSINARDEGARLLQAGNLDGALHLLEQAIRQDPADARAFAFLGICRTRKGDPSGGIEALTQATRISPSDAVLRYNLGVALSQAGRAPEAIPQLEQTLTINPSHAGARELLHRLQSAPASAFVPTAPPAPPPSAAPAGYTATPSDQAVAWAPAPQPQPQADPAAAWAPAPQPPPGGPPAWTPAQPAPAGAQHDAYTGSPAAMYYAQDQTYGGQPPSVGRRLLRGWGWGIVYGQWWTLWSFISAIIWGRASADPRFIALTLQDLIVFGFFGSLVGLTIGAANLDEDQGSYVGIGAGMLVLGLEFLQSGSALSLINVFFYFFTGRYVGRGIAGRVQQPVT